MKLLVLGTHGQHNIADEFLLETFLTQFGATCTYAVNSYDPAFTAAQLAGRFDAQVFHSTKQLPRPLQNILRANALVFGGGSIIQELPARVGRKRYATLAMLLATVTFAHQLAHKPIIMTNIGIGPIETPTGAQLAKSILRQVNLVSVCDIKSQTLYRELLPQGNVTLIPDALFANSRETLLPEKTVAPKSERVRVALNLTLDIENPDAREGFTSRLAVALRSWNVRQPLTLVGLPMQMEFKARADLSVLRAFQKRVPNLPFEFAEPRDAREAAQVLAGVDVVVAERFHTLVLSSIVGKPFVALMDDPGVRELVSALEMDDFALDINHPFIPYTLVKQLAAAWAQRKLLGERLAETSAVWRAELEQYFAAVRQFLMPGQAERELETLLALQSLDR